MEKFLFTSVLIKTTACISLSWAITELLNRRQETISVPK